ncbi:MAG: TIGR02266 family protein [Deltaproteobacteria bacterium]|nr:TIGR02266 family protein [Deltaproteobacteria bacterium]
MGIEEKRSSIRVPIDIWVEESRDGELYYQRTANISEGGLFFERTVPHPKGTIVNLKFTLPNQSEPIQVRGEIVNLPNDSEGLGMGVKFLDLTEQQRKAISDYINEQIKKR